MTKTQKIYRLLREHCGRDEARYAAPRIAGMTIIQLSAIRAFGA